MSETTNKYDLKETVLGYLRDLYAEDPDYSMEPLEAIACGFSTPDKVRAVLDELVAEGKVHTDCENGLGEEQWGALPGPTLWADDVDSQIAALTARAEAAERERDEYLSRLDDAIRDKTRLTREINTLLQVSAGEYWRWQSTGNDLESLTCPVLIDAEDLRTLALAEAESKANAKRAEEAESRAGRLRTRLRAQVQQTQQTYEQVAKSVADKLSASGLLPEGMNPLAHPIEQVVGCVVTTAKLRLEAALLAPANEKEPRHAQ